MLEKRGLIEPFEWVCQRLTCVAGQGGSQVNHFRQCVAILVTSLLSACGGGGGGAGGGGDGSNAGNSPLPDPGDSPPVVVYAGSSVGADLTSAVAPRMADHMVLLTLAT
jgi:hypothetical protein